MEALREREAATAQLGEQRNPLAGEENAGERILFRRALTAARRQPVPLATLALLLIGLVLWLAGRGDIARWALLAIVVLGGVPLIVTTLRQIARREFSVDVLALLAICGSLVLGEYLAGALIVLMLSGGNALEAYAIRRARSSLSALAERAPRTAHVWRGQQLATVAAEEIRARDACGRQARRGRAGGRTRAGGDGQSQRGRPDRRALASAQGSRVAGALRQCQPGRYAYRPQALKAERRKQVRADRAPRRGGAGAQSADHRLADRYALGFTAAALAVAALAWIVTRDSVYALAVLVVATPCPLILATPIAIMSGVDVAARMGLIVKSGAVIEQLGEVDVAVFDKTGTLTLGTPRSPTSSCVRRAQGEHRTRDDLLRLAASVEQLSSHVLAHAVVEAAAERQLPLAAVDDFEESFGKGVRGAVAFDEPNAPTSEPSRSR